MATTNLANDPKFQQIVSAQSTSAALSFRRTVVQDGVSQGIAYLNGAMSMGASNTARQFTKKVTTALSVTRQLGGAYAKMNVLEAISQRGDPVNNFEWLAVVVPKKLNASATVPWYYIDGINVPSMSMSSNEKFVNGKTNKYAGTFSVDGATMKIYSDTTGIGFDFANDWFRSMYRDDGLYQPPSLYKRNVYIYILDPSRGIVVDFKLTDVWPTAMATYELDGAAAHALETQLTLSVDDLKMNYDSDPQSVLSSVNKALGGIYDSASSAVSAGLSSVFK